jgi:chromate transport protein ChrA
MLKEKLVMQEKWITVKRFNRVFAVYQAVPGPEAAELCCYFGFVAHGRIGGLLGGLGFITPGFCFMLLLSWIYNDYGLKNVYFNASLHALHPAVLAMIVRAIPKLGEHTIKSSDGSTDLFLLFIATFSAIHSIAFLPFYLTLVYAFIAPLVIERGRVDAPQTVTAEMEPVSDGATASAVTVKDGSTSAREDASPVMVGGYPLLGFVLFCVYTVVCIVAYVIYAVYNGLPGTPAIGFGHVATSNLNGAIFLVGLMGGLLTFGGAYTSIPFLREEAVTVAGWLSSTTFIDALAIGQMIPAPLVMFATFIGFQANRFPGAILCTIGMFLPAFSFPILFHHQLDRVVNLHAAHRSLDALAAAVIGLAAVTALQLLRAGIVDNLQAIIFIVTLAVLFNVNHRYAALGCVLCVIIVGQVLFVPK